MGSPREQIIREYSAGFELVEPPGKARKDGQKKRKGPMPTSPPKSVQPAVPDESLAGYAEQDVIKAIEAVVRATTKAYGWRHLGDIGSFLSRSHALRG